MEPEYTPTEQEFVSEPNQSVWKTVTPLSKYLAMALFVLLPFVGGYVGYQYAVDSKPNNSIHQFQTEKKENIGVKESDLEIDPEKIAINNVVLQGALDSLYTRAEFYKNDNKLIPKTVPSYEGWCAQVEGEFSSKYYNDVACTDSEVSWALSTSLLVGSDSFCVDNLRRAVKGVVSEESGFCEMFEIEEMQFDKNCKTLDVNFNREGQFYGKEENALCYLVTDAGRGDREKELLDRTRFTEGKIYNSQFSPLKYDSGEVSNHSDISDCWIVYESLVFDITGLFEFSSYYYSINQLASKCGSNVTDFINFQTPTIGSLNNARFKYALDEFFVGIINDGNFIQNEILEIE